MCRKYEWIGTCLMALGAGLLCSLLFSSDFALAFVGIGLLIFGLYLARRQ